MPRRGLRIRRPVRELLLLRLARESVPTARTVFCIEMRWLTLAVLMLSAGCLRGATYDCEVDAQCVRPDDQEGECIEGWCAYYDPDCRSELRFSVNSAPDVAGTCVNNGDSGTSDDSSSIPPVTMPSSGSTSMVTDSGSGSVASSTGPCLIACDNAPSACFGPVSACAATADDCEYSPLPQGVVCNDGDPCTETSACSGLGACLGESETVCDDPPSTCFLPVGDCDSQTGDCGYTPRAEGSACEDGNPCTVGDTCDGAGGCAPGPVCPAINPCNPQTCRGSVCVEGTAPDGTSCGPAAASRCCGGACVNISNDEDHCGGCNTACVAPQVCETVSITDTCSLQPGNTTGRCRCLGGLDCPRDQTCRAGEPNRNGRCAPEVAGECAGDFQNIEGCPNYCWYE